MNRGKLPSGHGWLYGFWTGLTSGGLIYGPSFTPKRYTSTFRDDQIAIGIDMWNAIGRYQVEIENEEKKIQKTT